MMIRKGAESAWRWGGDQNCYDEDQQCDEQQCVYDPQVEDESPWRCVEAGDDGDDWGPECEDNNECGDGDLCIDGYCIALRGCALEDPNSCDGDEACVHAWSDHYCVPMGDCYGAVADSCESGTWGGDDIYSANGVCVPMHPAGDDGSNEFVVCAPCPSPARGECGVKTGQFIGGYDTSTCDADGNRGDDDCCNINYTDDNGEKDPNCFDPGEFYGCNVTADCLSEDAPFNHPVCVEDGCTELPGCNSSDCNGELCVKYDVSGDNYVCVPKGDRVIGGDCKGSEDNIGDTCSAIWNGHYSEEGLCVPVQPQEGGTTSGDNACAPCGTCHDGKECGVPGDVSHFEA